MHKISQAIFFSFVLSSCGLASPNQSYDESILEMASEYSFPLSSAMEVVAYGKDQGYFNDMPREKLLSEGCTAFVIHVSKDPESTFWEIHYQALGLIPSMSCVYRISPAGQPLTVPGNAGCSYNK